MSEIVLDSALTKMAPILALDGSGPRASVALVLPHATPKEIILDAKILPSDGLIASIERVLDDSSLGVSELNAIAVGLGPGSYTGLRVTLASAKGLAFGAAVSLFGFSSLGMLAYSAALLQNKHNAPLVLAVRDALRGCVYAGLYKMGAVGKISVVMPDTLVATSELRAQVEKYTAASPVLVTGDCSDEVAQLFNATSISEQPRALCGLALCQNDVRANRALNLATLTPNYLRPSLSVPAPLPKK